MLPEITDFAGPLTLVTAGLVLAAIATSLTGRLAIPALALFLAGAAIASDLFPSLHEDVGIITVERIGVVALIVILFNGGRDIGAHRLRQSLGDVSAIGLLGTFATAAALAVAAKVVLGLDWAVAGVLGAALAPTDPAVMFSVLGRREVGGRSGTVLEGEAGINDPAGTRGSTTSCSSWSWPRWSSRAGSSRPSRRACASRCNCSPHCRGSSP